MSGDDAVAMLKARLAGGMYPVDGVPDTPRNRDLWERIGREVADMPPGVTPEIPGEWTEMPDD
jgi:hypothetical protein